MLEQLMAIFKAEQVVDSRGRTDYGFHAHKAGKGHFKQNQRKERSLSKRRKIKSSAR